MRTDWQFLAPTADERERFADRAALARLPSALAAPANRNRRVLRIECDGAVWYWKQFGPTQWNNRRRFRITAPNARHDAEREARITLALRSAGIDAPRPVLWGADAAGSHYVCAPLAGEPLRALLLRGAADSALLAACARFLGDVLRRGFWLPDLSAEHVFVHRTATAVRFGLLDLHNGTLAAPGAPARWLLRRVLRHLARSVRDLPVAPRTALCFAARLLRSAGRGPWLRALLAKLPPLSTAARYEVAGKSADYAERNPRRAARELRLLARVWPGRPDESVLDVPCGAGRLLPFLGQQGHRALWADGALAMLREARRQQSSPPPAAQADAIRLPFADRCVAGVLQFRFLHHLPPELARQAVAECCRVADRFVVVSFFHPCSAHHLQRALRDRLAGRAPRRHAVALGRLRRWFAAHGFSLHAHAAELPFARDLWLASFVRG